VQAIGAAGLAATLAGCAEGEPAGEEQDAEGRYFRVPEWEQPDQLQYNPYNPTQYGFDVMQMATDQLFQYNPPEDEFIPQLAEDWEVDDDGL
jgi:ABC-type transport system substrate-binding protein